MTKLATWQNAVEKRRRIAPPGAAKPGDLQIEWLLLRPCEFPMSLARELSIVATLGSSSLLEPEAGAHFRNDFGEIYLKSSSLRRRTAFAAPAEMLRISYGDGLARQIAGEIGMLPALETLTYRKLTDAAAYEMVRILADEMRPGGTASPTVCAALALALLGQALRGCPPIEHDADAAETGLSRQRLLRALRYVDHRLGSDLTVADLAQAVDMSLFHFTRAFKQSTGKTPHAYVLERRVAAAQSLVQNTTRPLGEIAEELGFSNPSHFSSVFARLTGSTPSAYRKASL